MTTIRRSRPATFQSDLQLVAAIIGGFVHRRRTLVAVLTTACFVIVLGLMAHDPADAATLLADTPDAARSQKSYVVAEALFGGFVVLLMTIGFIVALRSGHRRSKRPRSEDKDSDRN